MKCYLCVVNSDKYLSALSSIFVLSSEAKALTNTHHIYVAYLRLFSCTPQAYEGTLQLRRHLKGQLD